VLTMGLCCLAEQEPEHQSALDDKGLVLPCILVRSRIILRRGKSGLDHGVDHLLLFLYDAKAPHGRRNKGFKGLGYYAEWPKMADKAVWFSFTRARNARP
jgi:hypothetical protein